MPRASIAAVARKLTSKGKAPASKPAPVTTTREVFIARVRALAVRYNEKTTGEPDANGRERIMHAKLTYGAGSGGTRGVCYYGAWTNGTKDPAGAVLPVEFIEVCATGEQSTVQLAGTTVHECAHVLAGHGSGHGPEWKAACGRLGLVSAEAAGQEYKVEHFAPVVWAEVSKLGEPSDGKPTFGGTGSGTGLTGFLGLPTFKPRPCPMGIGTRGGKSRGAGSGSRLRLYTCACPKPVRVRVASDEFKAHCDTCGSAFAQPAEV